MNTKHTPGPWEISHDNHDGWPLVMASGNIVANVNLETFSAGVADLIELPAEANARLIAAAPELLTELQTITSWREVIAGLPAFSVKGVILEDIDDALSIIAKATGQ